MDYFHWVRREIHPLLPKQCSSILEVGAGAGATLRWLKGYYPNAETTGVEINPALSDELGRNVDRAIIGSVDEIIVQLKKYDLILLLDVLEHLPDPSATLQSLAKTLNPGGRVIISVPNIAHFSVSLPLLLHRRFDYQEAGILDRTHLKFFVEDTAIKLLSDAGLKVTDALISGMERRAKIFNFFSRGLLRHYLARQYIMLGQLSDRHFGQQAIRWQVATDEGAK
ncbi:Methyltransferase domain-containing protein [Bradyrhizobium shewense]|uniref:Methyltransferase domain-containing protein n=1 Tax=Bradyrhizobium shewense TaxID=1761772 RepID=A0A1C3TZ35_9BRAD|nr:class I SAM-dependent methyltransferase [Bradyrhizobium shewense]SCB08486.1 Methyltransferase domain-containing protein [Bradyrhizobium shewense]